MPRPAPPDDDALAICDALVRATPEERERILAEIRSFPHLSWRVVIASGRFWLLARSTRNLGLMRYSVISRAIAASDPRVDSRDCLVGIPEQKQEIAAMGGEPEALFGEIMGLFPGGPTRVLAYYGSDGPLPT